LKKLYRSKTNKKIAGVCGGIAEYLNIDPMIIRLVWLLLVVCAGTGALAYLICMLILPEAPDAIEE
jgi:phage shock protein PspC (stress-responsive transcriptional regulator)